MKRKDIIMNKDEKENKDILELIENINIACQTVELTPKEYISKLEEDSTELYNAIFEAVYNKFKEKFFNLDIEICIDGFQIDYKDGQKYNRQAEEYLEHLQRMTDCNNYKVSVEIIEDVDI
jgi:hypothetical protein